MWKNSIFKEESIKMTHNIYNEGGYEKLVHSRIKEKANIRLCIEENNKQNNFFK